VLHNPAKSVEDELAVAGGARVVTLLEEPRAELTAMFTLRLLHGKGVLTRAEVGPASRTSNGSLAALSSGSL
jgi:hypothetical protein